ncbi:TonB-dependent receptor [Palleniella muris]|uniref:TonB-dependent receptor n=2 Tax=Palleniella muris TaxID=3038145 RepID=A0AC61QMJ7_9BACT|nr:TonB-dependent receptor [Palleniella muris]
MLPVCQVSANAAGNVSLAAQQQGKVTGVVVDANGEPVIGATVMVKGSSNGSIADIEGKFTISNVPANAVIQVSYVGYKTATVAVKGQSKLRIVLEEDAASLDELVVVGYGVQKKSDVTGALTRVGEKELQARPVSNAFEALQGKAAGVDITSSERPGTVGDIRIRGERSITAQNAPLYVVDGVPLMSGSGIETLNPRDIEAIDILKDASATAIYGSRGANGVVIVTTKQGKAGQLSLNYSGSVTFQNLVDRSPSISAADYIQYRRWAAYNSDPAKYADPRNPTQASDYEIFRSIDDATARDNVMNGWQSGSWNPNDVIDYDWTGQALRTGVVHEHTINASGGTDKLNAFGSFGYLSNKGTQQGQEYNRFTARLGMNINPTKWMSINMSFNASRESQDYGMSSAYAPSSTNSAAGLYELYKKSYRWALPYDANGDRVKYPGGDNLAYNPINEWEHNISNRETYRILGSLSAQLHLGEIWAPLKGLEYKLAFGPDFRNYRKGDFIDEESAYNWIKGGTNQSRWEQRRGFSYTLDNMITYNRTFAKKHNVGLTLLQSATEWRYETANMGLSRIENDEWLWNAMGSLDITDKENGASMSTGINERQLESYMIRLNYAFNDRYLLTASGRWDGASQLSKGRKWAFFPSMSLGWRIQEEAFMKDIRWIDNLKLRAGVGVTGNSSIQPYSTLGKIQSIYVPTSDGYDKAYTINDPAYVKDALVMANTQVGWEKTTQWNFGLDYGFLGNRIFGSLDVYFSKTNDLLLAMSIPTVTGYSSTIGNIGKTSNHGVELTVNAIPVVNKDFRWETSFNMAWQKDKIDELANGKEDDIANARFIGEQLNVYYDFLTDGLWQDTPEDQAEMAKWNANGYKFTPGNVKPVDQNGDYKMVASDDKVIIGNKRPTFTAGWNNTFNYKGLELSFQLYGRFGYWVHAPQYLFGFGGLGEAALDYWTPDNTGARFQKPVLTSAQTGDTDQFSSQNGYEKANFIRMRNISLGYTLPSKLLKNVQLKNVKVYAQVINPFDLHQSVAGLDLDTGNSYFNRSWVIGLELGF